MDTRASGKIRPDLPYGSIKSQSRQLACPVGWCHLKCGLVPKDKVEQASVRDFNTFRLARRSRCVDNVGEISFRRRCRSWRRWLKGQPARETALRINSDNVVRVGG